ncbi:DUF4097 domain-containing protein [Nonomuraea sp. NBC_01738]|uniref:hypothetical protein n=1 Tax=Nonomuraea sp. NBC_01738 TaxID=2976003 RepID=UPI002E1068EA|nr:DUF4097 domain-containing protein [Nonomuraea sp. NBC_01738]
MRPVWLAFGAVTTVLILGFFTVVTFEGFGHARPPTEDKVRAIPFRGERLAVEAGEGVFNLNVVPGADGEIRLARTVEWSADKPRVTEEWDGKKLSLAVACDRPEDMDIRCQASYVLFVPVEVEMEASSTAGSLDLRDLFGDVRARSVSGEINMSSIGGDVWIRSGSGDVMGNNLRGGRADAESGSGNIRLDFQEQPTNVKAVVRTEGAVEVNVHSGTYDVRVDGTTSKIRVKRDSGSPRKITVDAPDSTVSVCCS